MVEATQLGAISVKHALRSHPGPLIAESVLARSTKGRATVLSLSLAYKLRPGFSCIW